MLKIGDYVSRKKYGNDIIFIIDRIEDNIVYLKGCDVRLYADASINDLILMPIPKKKENKDVLRRVDSDTYFYIPGVVLHLDSDKNYLEKCINYYKNQNIKVYGYISSEENYKNIIIKLINKYNPNIVVITGHDAYYKKGKNGKKYKNSEFFVETVKMIRRYRKDIIIFSGACQSNYEELIKSGSSFASSPKRVNIHALDPAIVASYLALWYNVNRLSKRRNINWI